MSTGAADDLARVTDIARAMITRNGMDEKLGLVALEDEPRSMLGVPGDSLFKRRQYSEETAREVDVAVRQLVDEAFARALSLLTTHRQALERGAQLLLEKETLTGEELPTLG